MVDLHTHTTASDGLLTPAELVEYAASLGVSALAVTDHDTVAGVSEARESGRAHGLTVIAGIELEAHFVPGALHILGLGLTRLDERLETELIELRKERTRRNLAMLSRLAELGVDASYEELVSYAHGAVVGRPHLAELLVDRGIAESYQDAFDRYLADGGPAHEPLTAPSVTHCINLIHRAGGLAVVAHPRTLRLSSWRKITDALTRWKALGLDGVEAYHAGASRDVAQQYAVIARRLGLVATAGSDYHGRWGRPGVTGVGMEIDDAFAAPFLAEAARR
ncbi:MAG: PHP domain-containing protein [Spirochaetaceae bacterium]